MRKMECFKIQVLETENPFELSNAKVVNNIKCGPFNKSIEPNTIIADPFLYIHNDMLYMFYESKKMYRKGTISMICTKDLIKWSEPITVLSEKCHLSYPWVFKENDKVYMIPETCELGEIRLYEANKNLTEFKYVKTLLKDDIKHRNGFSFSDSSIYKKDNLYYLITTTNDEEKNILHLYVSDSIMGEYKKHIKSPICIGNKYGRNAGCFLRYRNKLFRVAQDCDIKYGNDVNLFEIKQISDKEYTEELIKRNLINNITDYYKDGGHQYNFVKYKGKYIVATDAKEYHYLILNKIFHKLKKY